MNNQLQRLPQGLRGVVADESVNETHLVYQVVLALQEDVKGVNSKFDKLGEQFGELKAYMIQTKALEQDRNLPGKIEAQGVRIQTLENGRIADQAMLAGQLKAARTLATFAAFVSTVLGIWLAVKALTGK